MPKITGPDFRYQSPTLTPLVPLFLPPPFRPPSTRLPNPHSSFPQLLPLPLKPTISIEFLTRSKNIKFTINDKLVFLS
ncbi:MAG: hypothetical protein N2035_07950 [Chthoniobacterales bacterium]|nr:hypothetical protein [Chthoniobacterales bacterium]